jgi:uncharacterized membrane protein YhiD involved in acid resistance
LHPSGELLAGLGQFIGSLVGACVFIAGLLNRKNIRTWFSSHTQLINENRWLTTRLHDEHQGRVAAEQRATNWEAGAQGAKFNADEVMERLAAVEREAAEAKALIPKFNALVDFTKRLLRHAVALEQMVIDAGKKPPRMPSVPDILADKLLEG